MLRRIPFPKSAPSHLVGGSIIGGAIAVVATVTVSTSLPGGAADDAWHASASGCALYTEDAIAGCLVRWQQSGGKHRGSQGLEHVFGTPRGWGSLPALPAPAEPRGEKKIIFCRFWAAKNF